MIFFSNIKYSTKITLNYQGSLFPRRFCLDPQEACHFQHLYFKPNVRGSIAAGGGGFGALIRRFSIPLYNLLIS